MAGYRKIPIKNRSLAGVQFQLTGDWGGKLETFERMPRRISEIVLRHQVSFAERYKQEVLDTINSNGGDLGWAPHSKEYSQHKRKNSNSSPTFYNLYGNLIQSIGYEIKLMKPFGHVTVGVFGNAQNPDTKMSVGNYAKILEVGSIARNIQPRPLFGPVFKKMGGLKAIAIPLQLALTRELKIIDRKR